MPLDKLDPLVTYRIDVSSPNKSREWSELPGVYAINELQTAVLTLFGQMHTIEAIRIRKINERSRQ